MTAIDWLIGALILVLVPIGFSRGLMVAGLGLGGFAVGAAAGARLAPLLLEGGSSSPYAPGVALLGGVVLGGGVALVLEGLALSLRGRLGADGPLARLDAIGGGLVFAVLALAISWVAGALALNAPALREVRDDVGEAISLVLLDVMMPRLNGHWVCEGIRLIRPELPVVFCTGYDPDTIPASIMLDQRLQVVQKPFDADVLLRAVREALDERQPCLAS